MADDVEGGLIVANTLAAEGRAVATEGLGLAQAVAEVLIARGLVEPDALEARAATLAAAQAASHLVRVHLGLVHDKYAIASPPADELDCAALLPLCKAKCCRLWFPLTRQDLDEGVVRWDHERPYSIRREADGWCTHLDRAGGGCGVYAQRPAACRAFDCRRDPRIWRDFAARLPAD